MFSFGSLYFEIALIFVIIGIIVTIFKQVPLNKENILNKRKTLGYRVFLWMFGIALIFFTVRRFIWHDGFRLRDIFFLVGAALVGYLGQKHISK